ncbi:TIGR01244 family phosphatase [Alkalicaulis satelles]|uniref:TIGR01244 family phosphatase n=1 Tax=Alkalicaulis satelles TaxID=2609175 RepID=A0A5M6Z8I3_9PROT|nr:TIGR01244 family sulfur transferase [Alkalicaulis satelles]KAA5800933.1 TIGR01244 family phosphatase [Alkalicaulis satelles]
MTPRPLTDQLSVSPQISAEDIKAAAEAGFDVIINNRPDGEDPGQPEAANLQALAEAAGLTYVHIPVSGGQFTKDAVDGFKAAAAQGKTLAYCRTGTRCTVLWALGQAGEMSGDDIIARAANAGYDLSGLRPRLGD